MEKQQITLEEIAAYIDSAVKEAIEEKESAKRADALTKMAEEAKAKVSELMDSLDNKGEEVATLEANLETKDSEIAAHVTKISELTEALKQSATELATAKTELAEATEAIGKLEKDKLEEARFSTLTDESLVVTGSETRQRAKIRNMSEEDFVDYVSELKSIRKAALESATTEEEEEDVVSETPKSETARIASLNVESEVPKEFASRFIDAFKEVANDMAATR